jgi:hypothetical protein
MFFVEPTIGLFLAAVMLGILGNSGALSDEDNSDAQVVNTRRSDGGSEFPKPVFLVLWAVSTFAVVAVFLAFDISFGWNPYDS